jgi:hypothetical protein
MVADPASTEAVTESAPVNRARLGVRLWCRGILHDVAPAQPDDTLREPGLTDLSLRPVATLRVLLQHDPQPFELRPTDQTFPESAQAANDGWQRLLTAAEVAGHTWATSDPASRPEGERAWATVADVAAVAEAAALLDRGLRTRAPGPPGDGRTRDCWDIAVAAEHVRRLAASGWLPVPEPLRSRPNRVLFVSARHLGDVAPALANLAALLTHATHLRPETVGGLATAHARTLDTLATILTATSPPAHRAGRRQFAAALRAHGETLLNVQVECRRLRSLDADDPQPALQMREIRASLRHIAAGPDAGADRADQVALLASLRPALSFAPSIAAITRAHVSGGHWLQPAARNELGWEKAGDNARITYAIELAAADAQELTSRLPPRRPTPSPFRSPHDLLDQRQMHRDRRRGPSPAGSHPVVYGVPVVGP